MTSKRPFHEYLKKIGLGLTMAFAVVVSFNLLMDPYGVYDIPGIDGINIDKPVFRSHSRLAKAYQVRHQKPAAIILGTSRGDVGLDPNHPGWGGHPVYNLAFPVASIYEMLRYFQHAHSVNPLKQVVIDFDFFQFQKGHLPRSDFDEKNLAVDSNGLPQTQGIDTYLATLASLDAISDGMETLSKQGQNPGSLNNGRATFFSLREQFDHHEEFLINEHNYFNKQYRKFVLATLEDDPLIVGSYRTLLKTAYRREIDFRLMISPSHARQQEVIAAKGLWSTFEKWKRQLAQVNEDEARKAGKPSFPVWDFSGYNTYTTEEVPPLGDKMSSMEWYWESSHYKKELGDRVLDLIFSHVEPGRVVAEDFGVKISSDNIEQHLAKIRRDREHWRTTHPSDVAETEALRK